MRPPACALCPREGGVLKRCAGARWAHCACALWTPETWLDAGSGLIQGLDRVPRVCACNGPLRQTYVHFDIAALCWVPTLCG